MIILDTNVISELMRPHPESRVINWIDQQDTATLFITAITLAEIHYGIQVLPRSQKRDYLENAFNKMISELFKNSILVFDESSSIFYGRMMSKRRALGQPLSILDGQIAAISRAKQMHLATRNIKYFQHCEINLIDPWNN